MNKSGEGTGDKDTLSINLENPIPDLLSVQADKLEYDGSIGRLLAQYKRNGKILRVEVLEADEPRVDSNKEPIFPFCTTEELEQRVVERLKNGEPQSVIAASIGKSQAWVSRVKSKYNL